MPSTHIPRAASRLGTSLRSNSIRLRRSLDRFYQTVGRADFRNRVPTLTKIISVIKLPVCSWNLVAHRKFPPLALLEAGPMGPGPASGPTIDGYSESLTPDRFS